MIGDDDGWRVKEFEHKATTGLSLWLELKVGGELLTEHSRRVWQSPFTDNITRGAMSRWKCLWEAVARFLNSGGTFQQLRDISQPQLDMLPDIEIPGYFLLSTEQELDLDMPTHTFAPKNGGEQLIVWTEDASLEMTTVEAEDRYREEAEDDREDL